MILLPVEREDREIQLKHKHVLMKTEEDDGAGAADDESGQ